MDPALAARVVASVRGKKAGVAPRTVAFVRAGLVLAAIAAIAAIVIARRRETRETERERAALLDAARARALSLTTDDRTAFARAEATLARLAGPYEGDFVAPALRSAGALDALLAKPLVYVRGPALAFATSRAEAIAASTKDALVLCLVDPPASRAERAMLGKVRAAYGGGAALEGRTENVVRLQDEDVGMRVLRAPWAERVRGARDDVELASLRRELEQAPIDKAKLAARARLLVAALDEPPEGAGPADLDGERAHPIRVFFVDPSSAEVLLRVRRRVDPAAWSAGSRAQFSGGLDACALAFDVRESVR
jgi:hypothetical protein